MEKTIVEINSTNYASTGNIMLNTADCARKNGYVVYTCCKASKESKKHLTKSDYQIIIGFRLERIISSFLCSLTGLRDHFNIFGTLLFVQKLNKIDPSLIHLHTMHDDYINIKIFFKYLSRKNIPVVWTFHDCNAITGKCPHFEMIGCNKWKYQCNNCPQQHIHPNSYFFDTSKRIYNERKKYFNLIKNMVIVTPSIWLANISKQSFFNKYNIITINNGINLDIFKRVDSNFKKENNIGDKYVLLGVANVWGHSKGLDVFIKLSSLLPDNYQIVLVGTNNHVDKLLPKNIISIHRTYNQEELIKIYSGVDLFVNPTREDNFPTVNIESLACGTPVLTFDTGGSPEIIDKKTGCSIAKNNISDLVDKIKYICENKPFSTLDCLNRANNYDANVAFKKYIELFDSLINDNHL